MQPSNSQTMSSHPDPGRLAEIHAAAKAVAPIHTPPIPGTAVNDPACSMVLRMYRRLSIACACISAGRGGCALMGRIDGIKTMIRLFRALLKYFVKQSKISRSGPFPC